MKDIMSVKNFKGKARIIKDILLFNLVKFSDNLIAMGCIASPFCPLKFCNPL